MTLLATQQFFTTWLTQPACDLADIHSPLSSYLKTIPSQKLHLYKKLYLENIEGILKTAFPHLHQFLSAEKWDEILLSFLRHKNPSPHYRDIPLFFAEVVLKHSDNNPFLKELTRFEKDYFYLPFFENSPHPSLVHELSHDLSTLTPVFNEDLIIEEYHFDILESIKQNRPVIFPQGRLLALSRHPVSYKIEKYCLKEEERHFYLLSSSSALKLDALYPLWAEKFSILAHPQETFLKTLKNLIDKQVLVGFKN